MTQQTEQTVRVDITRHGYCDYNNYLVIEDGGDANRYVDYRSQVPDLRQKHPKGEDITFARKAAERFANSVKKDECVVIISSREMRAYQTAGEYVLALEREGRTAVDMSKMFAGKQYPVGINAAKAAEFEESGGVITLDQRIVPVDFASLFYKAMWAQDMMEPPEGWHNTTFAGLDESQIPAAARRDYRLAREIIRKVYNKDPEWANCGWGDNWARFHKLEPFRQHIPSVDENTQRMTDGLIAIVEGKYAPKETGGLRPRYLVVTHEENVIGFTQTDFGTSRVHYCDRLALDIPLDRTQLMSGTFKDATRKMAHLYIAHLLQK
ncbi:hypothetical protein HZC31_08695 [Candidatus Woesearchaeota archaeon]|nr:hypothetical protein [Candidatus Woesearchaeota archaeon]